MVRQPDATVQSAPQDIQLMSKNRALGFKPDLRLEWRGKQNETEQPNHSASLGDSITASTRMRFLVHTRTDRARSAPLPVTAFPARPPNLPPRPLMTMDFAISCLLVRSGRPRCPVFVHRAAGLLHASFRLATTPLRFANPSPSSGWVQDFHLQAVEHARHTAKGPGAPDCGMLDQAGVARMARRISTTYLDGVTPIHGSRRDTARPKPQVGTASANDAPFLLLLTASELQERKKQRRRRPSSNRERGSHH
jgi:hypothetical protein